MNIRTLSVTAAFALLSAAVPAQTVPQAPLDLYLVPVDSGVPQNPTLQDLTDVGQFKILVRGIPGWVALLVRVSIEPPLDNAGQPALPSWFTELPASSFLMPPAASQLQLPEEGVQFQPFPEPDPLTGALPPPAPFGVPVLMLYTEVAALWSTDGEVLRAQPIVSATANPEHVQLTDQFWRGDDEAWYDELLTSSLPEPKPAPRVLWSRALADDAATDVFSWQSLFMELLFQQIPPCNGKETCDLVTELCAAMADHDDSLVFNIDIQAVAFSGLSNLSTSTVTHLDKHGEPIRVRSGRRRLSGTATRHAIPAAASTTAPGMTAIGAIEANMVVPGFFYARVRTAGGTATLLPAFLPDSKRAVFTDSSLPPTTPLTLVGFFGKAANGSLFPIAAQ